MITVVDEGSTATRNGLIIDQNYEETSPVPISLTQNIQVCYNEDIEYDFLGHTLAGCLSWLRKVLNHFPVPIENCVDFWISASLKSFYNIPTKIPKFPCPKGIPIPLDMCPKIGKSYITHIRSDIIKETGIKFNYQLLISLDKEYFENIPKNFIFGDIENPLFNLNDSLWNDALFWK